MNNRIAAYVQKYHYHVLQITKYVWSYLSLSPTYYVVILTCVHVSLSPKQPVMYITNLYMGLPSPVCFHLQEESIEGGWVQGLSRAMYFVLSVIV